MADPLDRLGDQKNPAQISALVGALWKRKWLIAGLTMAVTAATALIASRQPRVYEATATLVIESSVPQYLGAGFKDFVEMEPSWWSSREALETEFRILRSHSHAEAVAKALCDKKFGTDGAPALRQVVPGANCNEPADRLKAAPLIQDMLSIDPVRDSRLVRLTVNAHDPQFAALLANTAGQVYVDRNLERRLSSSSSAATWLGDEYGDLSAELNRAESALMSFKTKNNIVSFSLEDDQNEISVRRKKLTEELNSLDVKLIAVRAQREHFQTVKTVDPLTDLLPGLIDSPVAQKLKELYLEQYGKLLELKGRYLEKHPTVAAQTARLDAIREDLNREAELARKNVDFQFQTLTRQVNELRAALNATTKEALQVEAKSSEYNRLKRDLDRLVKLSEHVGGRERETSLVSNLRTNNVRVLDAALTPSKPISPNVPRAVAIAAAAGLLLAIGLALALESLDNTVKTQEDIEKVDVAFLGLIPTIEGKERGERAGRAKAGRSPTETDLATRNARDLYVLTNPNSSVAECCRAIRTNLLFMSPDNVARTLLITSAGPQEGKTTVAVNLAVTMALSGLRVLLVDTDMRRPRVHKALGIAVGADGLSRVIVGECDISVAIRESGAPNLWLLPCGASPPNPAELLHAERFKKLVADLAERFDRVIFDSPPVGAVTDAAILAQLTHGTVLVAKAGRTSRDALARARRHIMVDGKVNILGCILNDLDLSKHRHYGYYYQYYSRYGAYYREEDAATADAGGRA